MPTFDIIAGLASIIGLLFSIGAFVQAGRASQAAKEARDGILVRTLADEFEVACTKAEQLLDFLQHDRLAEGAIRARELAGALSESLFRRSPHLSEERRDQLLNVRAQFQIIEQEIYKGMRQPFTPKRKEDIINTGRRCLMTLRENLGTIKGELDLGGRK